jgi:hypothetical protein
MSDSRRSSATVEGSALAVAMFEEEREAKAKAILSERLERSTNDNSPESKRVRRLLKEALQRSNADWLNGGAGK